MADFDLLVRSEQDIGISEGKIVALGANLPGAATIEMSSSASKASKPFMGRSRTLFW